MQQLQNASDSQTCARNVLEGVLAVMVTVRESAARRHARGGCSLVHIRAMGVLRKRPGATLSDVADQLALTLSATSRLIDSLVDRKLIRRDVPPDNRRKVSLQLTPAGKRMLEAAMGEAREQIAACLETLPPDQRSAICHAMSTLQTLFDPPPADQ